jgi:hypothetical protein
MLNLKNYELSLDLNDMAKISLALLEKCKINFALLEKCNSFHSIS